MQTEGRRSWIDRRTLCDRRKTSYAITFPDRRSKIRRTNFDRRWLSKLHTPMFSICIVFCFLIYSILLSGIANAYDNREYNAIVKRIIDGDTIVVLIDLGFGITLNEKIRFLNYDSPETFRPSCREEQLLGKKPLRS